MRRSVTKARKSRGRRVGGAQRRFRKFIRRGWGAAEFQSQTFKVARCCVRIKVEDGDAGDEELDPVRARVRTVASAPWEHSTQRDSGDVVDVDEHAGNFSSITDTQRSENRFLPAAMRAPDSPTLSVQVPSSPCPPARHPELESCLERKYEPSQAPVARRAQYDQLTWGRPH